MQFAQPLWITAGFFICFALYFVSMRIQKRKDQALQVFAAKRLIAGLTRNISQKKRRIKLALLIAAVFACFLALARPQYGYQWVDVKRKGIDILFAIDTSTSMLAKDIRPNRLERSKFAILDFVHQLEGDRVGLMPFAGSAYLMCPLTIDYSAFEQSLQAVTTETIPTPGTNIAEAIISAEKILQNDANHKILIIITDGENLQGNAVEAAISASEKNLTIFTVGVGTREGELIPLSRRGSQEFVKDNSGKFVTSKLDEKTLQEIALKTNGLYAPLGNKGQGLETIYQEKLIRIPKEELSEKRHKVPIERFPWALGFALFLFVVEFIINERKNSSNPEPLQKKQIGGLVLFLTCPTLLLHPQLATASPGEDAFTKEDYLGAADYYELALKREPENPELHYNYGAAAYKNNLYDNAIESFTKALQSDNINLQEKAYYNLGNARFRKGEESLQGDPQKTIGHWEDALTAYLSCLQLQPQNASAKFNHDLVKKKLEELQQQQKQQQQQEDNQGKKQEQGNDGKNIAQNNDENQPNQAKGSETLDTQSDTPQTAGQENDGADDQKSQSVASSVSEQEDLPQEQNNRVTRSELSKEEAEQLLNEMKNEEGTLNFIPVEQHKSESIGGKNW